MTKSTQQLADELVQGAIRFAPQTMFRGDFVIDETRLERHLLESIPLLELLEVARAAQRNQSVIMDKSEAYWDMKLKLENLQKKVEL